MSPTVKLLRELIARPSVNPAFLPGTSPVTGEHRVAEFLAATARKAGLGVEFQRVRLALILKQYARDGQHRHGEERNDAAV